MTNIIPETTRSIDAGAATVIEKFKQMHPKWISRIVATILIGATVLFFVGGVYKGYIIIQLNPQTIAKMQIENNNSKLKASDEHEKALSEIAINEIKASDEHEKSKVEIRTLELINYKTEKELGIKHNP